MILWFVGGAVLIVLLVFGDPRIDYRLVALGALAPDLPLVLTPLHSVLVTAGLLGTVMLSVKDQGWRRRLLAVPIGMLIHLALDGMFNRPDVFWWPFVDEFKGGRLPSFERPIVLLVVMELAGLVALWWAAARLAALREARQSGAPPQEPPSC